MIPAASDYARPPVDLTAFQRIAAADYLGDVTALELGRLRALRHECQAVEDSLSYLRRLVQGRLEILEAELARRSAGQPPSDLDALVAALPATMGDRAGSGRPSGRPPSRLEVPDDPTLTEELDAICDVAVLGSLPDLSDADLAVRLSGLSELERTVSARRRVVLDRLDALSAELTRRYREGEANPDSLLS